MTASTVVQAARQFLAATVETTPDTPVPELFDQATRARACIAALLAETIPARDLAWFRTARLLRALPRGHGSRSR
jgi:hypothetical protein